MKRGFLNGPYGSIFSMKGSEKMVYPVFRNVFKIATESGSSSLVTIKDLETFEVSIDGTVEEWTPMDMEGWMRRLMTGKSLSISFSGKRSVGDPGNDYIAEAAFKTGADATTQFEWTMVSGTKLSGDVVINVTKPGGGDSTNVDGLEFELMLDGKPTITPGGGE